MVVAGWYSDPTRRHRFRYRRVRRWTDHVSDGYRVGHDRLRPRWRRVLGTVLLVQLVLLLAIPVVLLGTIFGDPYPLSRVGLTRASGGDIDVLTVACPDERVRSVELERRPPQSDDAPVMLWSSTGDAPLPDRFALGGRVRGLSTDKALSSPVRPGDPLRIEVTTSDLPHTYGMKFRPREVRRGSILTHLGRHPDYASYRAAVLQDTPCEREAVLPLSFFAWFVVAQLALGAIGLALVVFPRYPAPRTQVGTPDYP